jgi:hypothetical protein
MVLVNTIIKLANPNIGEYNAVTLKARNFISQAELLKIILNNP